MKINTNFLYDLWIALFQFSNDKNINEKECTALVDIMSLVEKVLVLPPQNDDVPNIVKILAILTDFGSLELPHRMFFCVARLRTRL